MCDDSRALLDELFGKERNVPPSRRKNDAHYWNEDVCKNSLVAICFNDLWKHTKYYIQDKLKEVDKILTKHEEQVEQQSKLVAADRPREIQDRLVKSATL